MSWPKYDVEEFSCEGSADLAHVIQPGRRFSLLYVRCHFRRTGGAGTDTAAFTLDLDSWRGAAWDVRLFTSAGRGVGADVNFRVPVDELHNGAWTFSARDALTFNWTNPDVGEIAFGLVVGIGFERVEALNR